MEERSGRPPTALPPGLAAAIEARLEGRPREPLRASASRLSERYRAGGTTNAAVRDETDALAYALTRMPATYAAVAAALARLAERWPEFAPRAVLDIGCGLGAASYAAGARWRGVEATFLDRSRPFLALAQSLARESGLAAPPTVIETDFTQFPWSAPAHDLVIASYVLTELADAALSPLIEALWPRAAGALVIVEPGTPRDYSRLMTIRARLIELGAAILAPCPHSAPCPLATPGWCHFSVRLPRTRAHKMLKAADSPFEDEKFAYLIAARGGAPAEARIIAPVRSGKAGVTLRLCSKDGIYETFRPRRDKPRYEDIRRKDWGDSVDAPAEDCE